MEIHLFIGRGASQWIPRPACRAIGQPSLFLILFYLLIYLGLKGRKVSHPPLTFFHYRKFEQLPSLTASSIQKIERLLETDNQSGVRAVVNLDLTRIIFGFDTRTWPNPHSGFSTTLGVLHSGVLMRACPHQPCVHRQLLEFNLTKSFIQINSHHTQHGQTSGPATHIWGIPNTLRMSRGDTSARLMVHTKYQLNLGKFSSVLYANVASSKIVLDGTIGEIKRLINSLNLNTGRFYYRKEVL